MDVFIFRSDLYCLECADRITADIAARVTAPLDVSDPDVWPQGPYADGGGEADCPQHCAGCGIFLENPLTTDGVEYVRNAIREGEPRMAGKLPAWLEWRDYYRDVL